MNNIIHNSNMNLQFIRVASIEGETIFEQTFGENKGTETQLTPDIAFEMTVGFEVIQIIDAFTELVIEIKYNRILN